MLSEVSEETRKRIAGLEIYDDIDSTKRLDGAFHRCGHGIGIATAHLAEAAGTHGPASRSRACS